jgi:hypothetical protein
LCVFQAAYRFDGALAYCIFNVTFYQIIVKNVKQNDNTKEKGFVLSFLSMQHAAYCTSLMPADPWNFEKDKDNL